ncbi:MAG: SDR family oxidoreductase [Acidimicrobiia bacterium]|nr:SDR family oxidoreductase [Acidimicrobiia bacterium]
MDIVGKVVVVTGGAGGIGEAIARRFAADGARGVAVVDLDLDRATAVATDIGGLALQADLRRQADVERVVASVEAELGPIDIFCSNAGIGMAGGVELPTDEWQAIWDINVMAHVHAARAVLPGMIERGRGYLVNTASAAGLLTQLGSAPYAVTKAAAVSLAEWLAITHGDQGISVSVLCPQAVNTAMIAGMDAGGVAGVDGILEPDDVAAAVAAAIAAEEFLITPHPSVRDYIKRKADDPDRWIHGMQRLQQRFPKPMG